ncbi:MAG: radical SAM protein [Spirochaetales bacterium]|nr:radical SAM protein [Spirochaetales bacterium]
MKYQLKNAVWEITYLCNMRCKHCGSGCGEKYPEELSTDEALDVCREFGRLGLKYMTLSGGEPFMRPDWPLIAAGLREQGVMVNVISNGWYIDDALLAEARQAGICNIGVSLDGLEETHDDLRRKGSFKRVVAALRLMRENKMPSTVCTTINKRNISELPLIKEVLYEQGVARWQLQLATPMGNLLEHEEIIMDPAECGRIVDFAFDTANERRVFMDLGDNIGYFHAKITKIRQMSLEPENQHIACWTGCQAGKKVIGLRANGDVVGCLSIRDDSYIEGNVRETSLAELWNKPAAFAWNRKLTREQLTGFCAECQYGSFCLGGCSLSKIMFNGSLTENKYCLFRSAVEKEREKIRRNRNADELLQKAGQCLEAEHFQLADLYYQQLSGLLPDDYQLLESWAYVKFSMKNYRKCNEMNAKILKIDPLNVTAWKGYGLSLAKAGDVEEGIRCLKRAVALADAHSTDAYHDLAVILYENGRTGEALEALNEGMRKFPVLKQQERNFYRTLQTSLNQQKEGPPAPVLDAVAGKVR